MEEKKKFILAIPTLIIIFVTILGFSLIFYNRNIKGLSREDAKLLTQKVLGVSNISCEIVTESSNEIDNDIVSYKLKDSKLVEKTKYYTIYDDEESKNKIQIDNEEKIAYIYSEYQSETTTFKEMIYKANELLENNDYNYKFNSYETMNGVKCASFTLSNSDADFNIWLDKSNGMITKIECIYHSESSGDINKNMYYRYQLNCVSDEDIAEPNLEEYTVVNL